MQCPCGGYAPSHYHKRTDGTKVITWRCQGCGRVRVIEWKDERAPVQGSLL